MDVHAHDHLGAAALAEGMLDAVGNVGGQSHLRLHPHLRGAGLLLQFLQQLDALLAVGIAVLSVVDHVECHEVAVHLVVPDEHGQFQQLRCNLGIFHADHDLLVIIGCRVIRSGMGVLAEDDLARGVVGHQRGDDAGDQNHDHHTVQHIVVGQRCLRPHHQSLAHHHHSDGTGGVGRCQTEHHVAVGLGQSEEQGREIGGQRLAERAEEGDEEHDAPHLRSRGQRAQVDQHTHADEEERDEQGIADKLDAVHQGRHLRYVPI